MLRFPKQAIIMFCILVAEGIMCGQKAPSVPDHPWDASSTKPQLTPQLKLLPQVALDPSKTYTLSELVDIAEHNNPDTRVAWENAKARAADLGITKSTLYPTLAAAVLASSLQAEVFFGNSFQRQTVETYSPVFVLDYTIFDLGRSEQISAGKSNLLAASFGFNDAHRKIIFQVMQAYYKFLDTKGREDAARANLKDAQMVQQAAEARLQSGLTTLPDVLETRSAAAQADFELQAAIGATEIALGDLAVSMGIHPTNQLHVESLQNLKLPDGIADTLETSIDKALSLRPDLMQRIAELRAASAEVKVARNSYFPTIQLEGNVGIARSYGVQIHLPGVYSPTGTSWVAALSLHWTLFDGLARENRLARARADQKQAVAAAESIRNEIENQVWSAYSTARTALRQQKAATTLLAAATESYNATLEAYGYGLRNQINVVTAQRTLADARSADVDARTQLLTGLASLAYQTGDLLYAKIP
jgi:outer membrane protein